MKKRPNKSGVTLGQLMMYMQTIRADKAEYFYWNSKRRDLVTSFTAFYKKIGINHADKISYILITII